MMVEWKGNQLDTEIVDTIGSVYVSNIYLVTNTSI